MIEAILSVAMLSIAAAGVLLPFTSGATLQAEGIHRTIASKLAGDLLEKIVSRPFDEIDDWNGYSETEGQVKDAAGIVFTDPAYAGFSRNVSCEYMIAPDSNLSPVFILVTVTVSYRSNELVRLTRLVSK